MPFTAPYTLRYRGLALDPKIETQLVPIARNLAAGHALATSIEPGDATRYDFVLTPITPGIGWVLGIGQDTAAQWVLASYFVGGRLRGTGLIAAWELGAYRPGIDALTDDAYTREVFAWWFTHLFAERAAC